MARSAQNVKRFIHVSTDEVLQQIIVLLGFIRLAPCSSRCMATLLQGQGMECPTQVGTTPMIEQGESARGTIHNMPHLVELYSMHSACFTTRGSELELPFCTLGEGMVLEPTNPYAASKVGQHRSPPVPSCHVPLACTLCLVLLAVMIVALCAHRLFCAHCGGSDRLPQST